MNQILIAEDEKNIRLGLKTMVQRSGVPVGQILEARNGREALELLQENKVDLLITDVRMPELDGIGLVEQAMKLPTPPLVLVISGYDDFSYAVAMMRNGVQEYLLKPVERKQLYDALQRLEGQVKLRQEADQKESEQELQALRILALATSAPDRQRLLELYSESFYSGSYVGVCAREAGDDGFCRIPLGKGMWLTLLEENAAWPCSGALAGRSLRHQGLEELSDCCREAIGAWTRAFFAGVSRTYQPQLEHQTEVTCRQLMDQLSISRGKEVGRLLSVQAKAVAQGNASAEDFAALCAEFCAQLRKTYRDIAEVEDAEQFQDIWRFESGSAYLTAFTQWLNQFSERLAVEYANFENKQKIRLAVQYIREHFREPLNMATVSSHVSMSYSLFSQLFKQYTGTNFVSYVQKLRLEEAKRLLETTDARVGEICYQVGFQDDKHFLKIFKSITGLSPSEYRRASGRRNLTET